MHFHVIDRTGLSIAQGGDAASMQLTIDAIEQHPRDRQPFILSLTYPGKDTMAYISFGQKDDGHWYSRVHFSQAEDPILDSLPILRLTDSDVEYDVPLPDELRAILETLPGVTASPSLDEAFATDLEIFTRLRSRYEYAWALRENLERRGLLTLCEQLDVFTLSDLRRACNLINERQRGHIEHDYREHYYRPIKEQATADARQFDLTGDRDTISEGVARFQLSTRELIEAELGKVSLSLSSVSQLQAEEAPVPSPLSDQGYPPPVFNIHPETVAIMGNRQGGDASPDPVTGEAYDRLFKIKLVGGAQSGKSSIFHHLAHNSPDNQADPGFVNHTIHQNGQTVKLQVWDDIQDAGDRRTKQRFDRTKHAYLICIDLTRHESLENAPGVINSVRMNSPEQTPIVVIGTKHDLNSARQISDEEFRDLCEANDYPGIMISTSENEPDSIEQAFELASAEILRTTLGQTVRAIRKATGVSAQPDTHTSAIGRLKSWMRTAFVASPQGSNRAQEDTNNTDQNNNRRP